MTMPKARFGLVAVIAAALASSATAGCSSDAVDIAAAKQFDGYPLYWVGERFEKWELSHLEVRDSGFTIFGYGTCTPKGEDEPSCVPPLQLQVSPLCDHLIAVTASPIWRQRRVRGAPVGTIDSAPVLLSRGAQVKVYRGEGSDPGLPMRTLRALRSINDVEPVIEATGPIPAPATAVLAGARPCR